MPWIYLDQVV